MEGLGLGQDVKFPKNQSIIMLYKGQIGQSFPKISVYIPPQGLCQKYLWFSLGWDLRFFISDRLSPVVLLVRWESQPLRWKVLALYLHAHCFLYVLGLKDKGKYLAHSHVASFSMTKNALTRIPSRYEGWLILCLCSVQ